MVSFLSSSSPFGVRFSGWPVRTRDPPVFVTPVPDYKCMTLQCVNFFLYGEGSNSGPCASKASTLPVGSCINVLLLVHSPCLLHVQSVSQVTISFSLLSTLRKVIYN